MSEQILAELAQSTNRVIENGVLNLANNGCHPQEGHRVNEWKSPVLISSNYYHFI